MRLGCEQVVIIARLMRTIEELDRLVCEFCKAVGEPVPVDAIAEIKALRKAVVRKAENVTFPLPPDDPQHVRALKVTDWALYELGYSVSESSRKLARATVAAYFSALQAEGVVFVEQPHDIAKRGGPGWKIRADKTGRPQVWNAPPMWPDEEVELIVKPQAEQPTPPCKACGGLGHMGMHEDRDPPVGNDTKCPRCDGSGLARMVDDHLADVFGRAADDHMGIQRTDSERRANEGRGPMMVALDDVVEWLRAGGDGVRRLELARLVADDIERRFSGTGRDEQ